MAEQDYDTLVIGGGISGLAAAYHLHRGGCRVGLIDAHANVGGATKTVQREGFLLEQGPFNVIVRDPAFVHLLEDLGDRIAVVTASEAAKTRYLYKDGALHPVPSSLGQLWSSKLLGSSAKRRMIRGLLWSKPASRDDETIEEAATRRIGRAATDTLVSAVIAGIYAGDIGKLCLCDCFPMVGAIDREARSLPLYALRGGFRKHTKTSKGQRRRWKGLVSLDGGLGSLSDALAGALGTDVMTNTRVERLQSGDDGFTIHYQSSEGESGSAGTIAADRVVLATPVHVTANLVREISATAAATFDSVQSAPMVVLNLGFRREQIGHRLNGFGYLVPMTETDHPLLGVLWASTIFPWHAPVDHCLLRVFIGGNRTPDAADRSDDQLLQMARRGICDVLQVRGDPMLVDICRWPHAIPQYTAGHRTRIADAQTRLRDVRPQLYLTGNYIEGVSLNDCIRNGTSIAREILAVA